MGGNAVDPPVPHLVIASVTCTVPVGLTVQLWVADPPAPVVAVTAKLLAVRDCAGVGVQLIVSPLRAAPLGAVVSA